MVKPKVSVVMPVYNARIFLRQAMDCLLEQTLKEIEMICVDDGSTDDSLEILQQYALRDKRVKILKQENHGAGAARNKGLEAAEGEYIIFLDCDDIFDKTMCKKAFQQIEKDKSDVVIFGAHYFLEEGTKVSADWMLVHDLVGDVQTLETKDCYNAIFNISGSNPWNKLFRRKYIVDNGLLFQEIKKSNDVYFVSMALALSTKISFLDEKLVDYRVSKNSIQGSDSGEGFEFYYALKYLKDKLVERDLFQRTKESFESMALQHCVDKVWNAKSYDSFCKMYAEYPKIADELGIKGYVANTSELHLEYKNYVLLMRPTNGKLVYEFIGQYKNLCNGYREIDELRMITAQLRIIIERMNVKKRWIVPYGAIKNKQKILIYGAGSAGSDIYHELYDNGYKLAGWVDKNAFKYEGQGISSVDSIRETDFDVIIIAISNEAIADEVERELIQKYNVEKEKIVKI